MSAGEEGFNATQIKGLGWRQGCIAPPKLVQEWRQEGQIPSHVGPGDLLILVSHDCDITHVSLAAEPSVELLAARLLPEGKTDSLLFHGRNPRRLHFSVMIDGSPQAAEARAHERFAIGRTWLANQGPDSSRLCDERTIDEIVSWLIKRYSRTAFPDTFDARRKKAQRPIARALQTNGKNIREVFIAMNSWGELPGGVPYQIHVVATMEADAFGDATKRGQAQQALDVMEEKLQACDGIEIVEALLVSEANVTLDDIRLMQRFDFDYLSTDEADSP